MRNKKFDFAKFLISVFIGIFSVITVYPFLYILCYSLSDSAAVMSHPVTFLPVKFTLVNFALVFQNSVIYSAFLVSVSRTTIGIVYALIVTGLAAYALSRPIFPGKRVISLLLVIPMYLSGGLIPYYVLIYQLGLVDNFLVFILPLGFGAFNMLVMRTYFEGIPESLPESARLDGAGELTIFIRLIVPLSAPIIATISMFVGVGQWNSWFDGMLFISNPKLMPMATMLVNLMQSYQGSDIAIMLASKMQGKSVSQESIKMATIMVSTIPIVCIYPFFQKYFIKGVMIGAVKA